MPPRVAGSGGRGDDDAVGDGSEQALGPILTMQDGVVTRSQALQCLSEGAVRHRLASGRWQQVHRGILVTHNGPITDSQRRWIGIFAGGNGRMAALAGLSALERSGMRGYPSHSIHILTPDHVKATKPPRGVVVHRTIALPRRDYLSGFPPRTAPARSVVDAAQWAPSTDRARAIVAAAFQQRLVTLAEISDVLARFTTMPRHRLITETAHDAAGGSESISEIDFVNLCRRGHLPTPARQTVVTDASGRRRYRDADFEEWRVHVEIDGASTSIRCSGGRICSGRTTCGARAGRFCDSPRGRFVMIRIG